MRELVRAGIQRLEWAGVDNARHEVEWLLARLVDSTPLELYLEDRAVSRPVVTRFWSQLEARASGVPLQHLLGDTEFCGHAIRVRPGVFIPRPETEAVVEEAVRVLRARETVLRRPLELADVGTGSGCIAIALAHALATCRIVAVEVSWRALLAARENLGRHGLLQRVRLMRGRWLAPLRGRVDAIVANPPYVPSAQVDRLPLDVRREPRRSLDGGPDGLRDALEIFTGAPQVLQPGGLLIMECGEEQVPRLVQQAKTASWVRTARSIHDLAGRPRGLIVSAG